MSKLSQRDIIEQINEKIDPRRLIEKINYLPEKIQIIGTALKCFCPIHKEKAFRSLIIDMKKKTFRCSLKGCRGFGGGTLVELYAIHTGQQEFRAAFNLVKLLDLPIDLETVRSVSGNFLQQAQQAFLERDIEKAQNFATQAIDAFPENYEARYILGQILDNMGDSVSALRELEEAAKGYEDAKEYNPAIEIYEKFLLRKEPRNEKFLDRVAVMYSLLGDNEHAIQYYIIMAGENDTRGEPEKNVELFKQILALDPKRQEIRSKLAKLYESADNLPRAVEQYTILADGFSEKGESDQALTYLKRIKQIVPENLMARQRLAEIYEKIGDRVSSEKEYFELGETAIEQDELETAEKFYQILLQKYPDSILAHEGLINLYEKMQNVTAFSRECTILAELLESAGDFEHAVSTLIRVKNQDPKDVGLREKIKQVLLESRRKDEAVAESFEIADLYHEAGDTAMIVKSLESIKTIDPKNIDLRTSIALKYYQYEIPAKAREEFIEFLDYLIDEEQYETSIEVCEKALTSDGQYIPFNERRITALTQLGRNEEAMEVYKLIYGIYKDANNNDRALEVLGEALSLDEDNVYIHRELVDVHLALGNVSGALSTLVSLSQIYYENGAVPEGIETALKIIELSPEAVATRERLAYLYKENVEFDKAIDEYSKATDYYIGVNQPASAIRNLKAILEIDENNREALTRLSEILVATESFDVARPYLMKGLELLKSGMGSTDEVVAEYRRILGIQEGQIALKEEFAEYLKTIGRSEEASVVIRELVDTYKSQRDYAKAVAHLKDLHEFSPQDNGIKAELADMCLALNIPQEAVNYYAEAALGFREEGQDKEAVKIYRKIVGIDPGEESVREELALLLAEQGEVKEAIEHNLFLVNKHLMENREAENLTIYQRLLELDAGLHDIREKLADAYEVAGENVSAAEELMTLSSVYEEGGDLKTAIGRASHAKELVPGNDATIRRLIKLYEAAGDKESLRMEYIDLGDVFLSKSDPDKAEVYYRKAQELKPDDIGTGELIARLNEARKNYKAACEEYRKIAILYEESSKPDKAIPSLRRVKALEPDDFECREDIARLLEKTHEIHDALREYYELAEMSFKNKSPERAMIYLKQLATAGPDDFEMRMETARLLFTKKKKPEAISELIDLCGVLFKAGRYGEVVQAAELGMEKDEKNFALRDFKINALLGMEMVTEAVVEYRKAVEIAWGNEEIERAETYLNNILEHFPEDVETLTKAVECALKQNKEDGAIEYLKRLIQVFEKNNDMPRAIEATQKILGMNPDDIDVMKDLARFYLQHGEQKEALGVFEAIADYCSGHGDFAEACNYLSRILEYDSESIPIVRKLANLIYEKENLEKARPHFVKLLDLCKVHCKPEETISEYETVLKIDSTNAALHLDYARFLRESKQPQEAKIQYQEAGRLLYEDAQTRAEAVDVFIELLELTPEDAELLTKIAALYAETERPEDAYRYYILCANLHLQKNQTDEALPQFLSALSLKPEETSLISQIAQLYEQTGQKDEAVSKYLDLANLNAKRNRSVENIELYEKILTLDALNSEVRQNLARLYQKQGDIEKATTHYIQLGRQYEDVNEPEQALSVYKHVRKIYPENEESRNRIAEIFLAAGKRDEARQELRELVDIQMKGNKFENAERYLLRMKEIDPDDVKVGEELAHLYEKKVDIDSAISEYSHVIDIYVRKEDYQKAIHTLQYAKALSPDNTALHERLFELYKQTGSKKEFVKEGMELATIYFNADSETDAVRICKAVSSLDPADVKTRLKIALFLDEHKLRNEALEEYQIIVHHLLHVKNYDEAIRVCDMALEKSPDYIPLIQSKIDAYSGKDDRQAGVDLYMRLADIHSTGEQWNEQEEAYRKAIDVIPEFIPAHEGLINVLMRFGHIEKVVGQLLVLSGIHRSNNNPTGSISCHQEILRLQPDNLDVRDGLATLYRVQGNTEGAIKEYFTLAEAMEQKDDYGRAKHYYDDIIAIDNMNVEALRALIHISEKQGLTEPFIAYSQTLAAHFESMQAFADAIPLYQGIIRIKDSYLSAYQKLAACLERIGNVEEALSIYKSLALQYQNRGAFIAAIQQLEVVEKYHPDDPENLQLLATLHLKMEHPDQAIHYFTSAVENLQLLDNLTVALDLVRQMISVRPERLDSHRLLAQVLESAGQKEEAAATCAHIASLLDAQNKVGEALEARATALRLSPGLIEEREKYARGLRDTGRSDEAFQQCLQIADEYISCGDYDKAHLWAQQALVLDESNPDVHHKLKYVDTKMERISESIAEITWLARYYIEQDAPQNSEELLNEGLKLDPSNLPLRETLVSLYKKTSQPEKATEQLLKITELVLFKGDIARAIASLEEARAMAGENVEIRKTLAGLYIRNNEPEKAREEEISVMEVCLEQGLIEDAHRIGEKIIEAEPKNCDMREGIAEIFLLHDIPELATKQYLEISNLKKTEGQYDAVIEFADKCLKLSPKSMEARENRVESLMKLDRRDEAYREFLILTDLYTEYGLLEKARDAYCEMARLVPDDPLPLQRLVTIYSLINNKEEQVAALRALAELYVKKGSIEDAVSAYQSILAIRPDDTRARLRYIDLYSRIGPELDLVADYLKLIDIFVKHGDMAEATRYFDKLSVILPDDPSIKEKFIQFLINNEDYPRAFKEMLDLANIYTESAQFKKAINILGQAVRIAPNDAEVHLSLADTYVRMNAKGMAVQEYIKTTDLYDKEGLEAKAIDVYEKILIIDPQNLEAHRSMIERLKKAGRTGETIEWEKKLANLYIQHGLLDLAENLYRDILFVDPENVEVWNFLIQTHLQIGLEGDLIDDYIALGNLYYSKGMLKDALQQYKKVIDASPLNVDTRRKYIETYLQIGLEHDLIDDYLELADVLVQKGEVNEAIDIYSHVMSLDPENERALTKLSVTRTQYGVPVMEGVKGELPEGEVGIGEVPQESAEPAPQFTQISSQDAIDNYKNILSVNPSNANVRCKLAEIYIQLNRLDDALAEWEKASETFIFKGELDKGIMLCEKILSKKPSDAKARERLSRAMLQKDYFKAIDSAISSYADSAERPPGDKPSGEPTTGT